MHESYRSKSTFGHQNCDLMANTACRVLYCYGLRLELFAYHDHFGYHNYRQGILKPSAHMATTGSVSPAQDSVLNLLSFLGLQICLSILWCRMDTVWEFSCSQYPVLLGEEPITPSRSATLSYLSWGNHLPTPRNVHLSATHEIPSAGDWKVGRKGMPQNSIQGVIIARMGSDMGTKPQLTKPKLKPQLLRYLETRAN